MEGDHKIRRSHDEIPRGLARVSHIIAIGSGKGGVGKSTVATNFAVALSQTGAKVGLLDADIYGPSQPEMLGVQNTRPEVRGDFLIPLERHGLVFMSLGLLLDKTQPVVWRGPMASKMIQQFLGNVLWGDLDYLIIDLPPGSGDVQITLAQQAALTGAIIVTTPQQVALGVAQKGLEMFRNVNVPIIGIVENMSGFTCPHCGTNTPVFKQGGGQQLAEELGVDFLGGIPLDPELMAAGDNGMPIMATSSDGPAAREFRSISNRFIEIMKRGIAGFTEPAEIKIDDDRKLAIVWDEQDSANFSAYDLRLSCSCALCVSEDTGQRILNPKTIPLDIRITSIQRVGRYAVSISFSDGHETGIFRFDRLRTLEKKQQDSSRQSFNV